MIEKLQKRARNTSIIRIIYIGISILLSLFAIFLYFLADVVGGYTGIGFAILFAILAYGIIPVNVVFSIFLLPNIKKGLKIYREHITNIEPIMKDAKAKFRKTMRFLVVSGVMCSIYIFLVHDIMMPLLVYIPVVIGITPILWLDTAYYSLTKRMYSETGL